MVPGTGTDDPRDGDPLAQPSRCHGTRSPCRMPLSRSLLVHKAGSQLSAGMCGAYQALLARLRPRPGSLSAARGAEAGPPCLFPTAGKPRAFASICSSSSSGASCTHHPAGLISYGFLRLRNAAHVGAPPAPPPASPPSPSVLQRRVCVCPPYRKCPKSGGCE